MKININGLITDYGNGRHYTQRQKKFLEKCLEFHYDYGLAFSHLDFPNMSKGNFRQTIHKVKPMIEIVQKSKPCLYKIKRAPIRKDLPKITDHPTGDIMIRILKKLREKKPYIHDIKGKFYSTMHKVLCNQGKIPHKKNKGFQLLYRLDYNISCKIQIYPQTVQFDLGCTNGPLAYDISGIIQLISVLSQLKSRLFWYSKFRAGFPPIDEWIITHYHFGKDLPEDYSGQAYHMTFAEVATGFVRFYSKSQSTKSVIHRFEQVKTPNSTLNQEIDKMILCQTQ